METVLVVGASGNIGVSVIIAALRSGRNVLAIVRSKSAESKIIRHVGTIDGITFVEAEVTDENSVQKVIEKVKSGELPAFQHVYSAGKYSSRLMAYRATVPYLIDQGYPDATWTLVTGSAGDLGFAGVTAISQGALFSLASVACLENLKTNVRFNEVYLGYRVDYDAVVKEKGDDNRMTSSEFSRVYEAILANKTIKGCRITVSGPADIDELKYKKKLPDWDYESLFAEYM
ncbi:nadp-binding [Trichoderma arundinaceum]|uniref:Nadp-binding n=1 Tax=Trichoderma arundinaceum TaxID=490622 RepID=A0A395NI41_TRIAR|nr:nadp-binding [Trichoderma arundinaceum]